ncbi:PepSY-associated TM helix domain-containing protein [Sphingobacterium griseoflavum]|uniref:Peptidase n=1 Tax=Sphingobacterium griseoflavum TaxID=1474952 RepID=A0ABQ3HXI6_9SPHI|nr:PepSY-associated TM helix domain-containing protein [Sphingobacterium griseoflavum]GHE33037.1 peptidase [Sphingobacterium griseoflavum]
MDHRKYNIYFHTHTISGIIIASLLYVIFFAGSFSFFKDNITAWQHGKSMVADTVQTDYNYLLDSLSRQYNLVGRNIDLYYLKQGQGAYVNMSVSADTTVSKPIAAQTGKGKGKRRRGASAEDSAYFLYYFADKRPTTYSEGYDMGEFLYRLHFLAQLNQLPIKIGTPFGYLLAGIVSFLFLFALITGVFLHWEKVKTNFFVFRPFSKWKTVWTDMHTALGVIGFPFQFVFAVTGIILIVNFVLITPFSKLLYDGNEEAVYEELLYNKNIQVDYRYSPLGEKFDLNAFVSKWESEWNDARVTRLYIRNFQDQSMQVGIEFKPVSQVAFAGSGYALQEIATGKVLAYKSPTKDGTYIDMVKSLIYHLHFGDFGGKPMQIIFFLLGLMGCLVIISGIVIWLVARDKNNVPAYKRKFNFWASNFFLAGCLSMLPVTAFTFVMLKLLPVINQSVIYNVFFYSWLILGIYLMILRNLARMNRHVLILSVLTCFAVPIANGMTTKLWFWTSWQLGATDIFFVDVLFTVLAIGCLYAFIRVRKQAKPFQLLAKT